MNTILVAAEGSPQGWAAVETAADLAADEGARLVCVHVISVLDFAQQTNGKAVVPPGRVPRAEEDPVLQHAVELAAVRGVVAETELLVGYPPTQICRLASAIGVDLIVVGSRGLGPVKSVVVGSTSRAVLAHADRPVLVVREAAGREATPA